MVPKQSIKMDVRRPKTNPQLIVYFKTNGFERGRVSLRHLGDGKFETHSSLDPAYRGKGYGIKMYERAILYCLNHGLQIRSSPLPSIYAQRVWKSKRLRSKFRIVKRGRRFIVMGLKSKKF